ncbi:MAG: nicotinamidase [Desulfuromonas sp.]|nr:MAG: nicotinamidase [Desulfuromonas sp.]
MGEQGIDFLAGDALLLVDVQIDFCPGGKLPISEGDRVVPFLNDCIEAAEKAGIPIIASRDWHPREHPSFLEQGGDWPTHCVQDTAGAAFHPDLRIPEEAVVLCKGTRFDQDQLNAFDQTGLEVFLRELGVRRLWVAGLALDVCVLLSVEGAREHGFDVEVLLGGCRPVTEEGGLEAQARMQLAGAHLHRG